MRKSSTSSACCDSDAFFKTEAGLGWARAPLAPYSRIVPSGPCEDGDTRVRLSSADSEPFLNASFDSVFQAPEAPEFRGRPAGINSERANHNRRVFSPSMGADEAEVERRRAARDEVRKARFAGKSGKAKLSSPWPCAVKPVFCLEG
mmetsp:Transcript_23630/g.58406  ORF Transcript_23630/g.58406 Transcript_23630/m.58406 type:complete len:147 (+) Transcript_23630:165-605(+)|eukprot:CAMPEP_0206234448 /NCGR_PEP_ID=MMETSP0047_2-20121206/12599_1 /ASSEMBLY_ACC=CAM_ASM_000192 /TAXON_ID=195065 /ORGANISM="Chroomonas mesostigmatica_cf, Strain CCMP1168" /LENGTH=146 /DNA_ID=CAMNT_0053658541 /DNA_START=143 /DNA_END=583 /DNA_ORIENTATION=-